MRQQVEKARKALKDEPTFSGDAVNTGSGAVSSR